MEEERKTKQFSWSAVNEMLQKTISKEDLYYTSGVCTEEKPRENQHINFSISF